MTRVLKSARVSGGVSLVSSRGKEGKDVTYDLQVCSYSDTLGGHPQCGGKEVEAQTRGCEDAEEDGVDAGRGEHEKDVQGCNADGEKCCSKKY